MKPRRVQEGPHCYSTTRGLMILSLALYRSWSGEKLRLFSKWLRALAISGQAVRKEGSIEELPSGADRTLFLGNGALSYTRAPTYFASPALELFNSTSDPVPLADVLQSDVPEHGALPVAPPPSPERRSLIGWSSTCSPTPRLGPVAAPSLKLPPGRVGKCCLELTAEAPSVSYLSARFWG